MELMGLRAGKLVNAGQHASGAIGVVPWAGLGWATGGFLTSPGSALEPQLRVRNNCGRGNHLPIQYSTPYP